MIGCLFWVSHPSRDGGDPEDNGLSSPMIPWLINSWLVDTGLYRFFRVFAYAEFRTILAAFLSFWTVIVLGPMVIRYLTRKKVGDQATFNDATLDEMLKDKKNTPTMGGVLILSAIGLSTVLLADMRPGEGFYVYMALVVMVWLGALGAIDDYLKLTRKTREEKEAAALQVHLDRGEHLLPQPNPRGGGRDGLFAWEKFVLQIGLGVVISIFIYHHGASKEAMDVYHINSMSHCLNMPFVKTWEWSAALGWIPSSSLVIIPLWLFVILGVVVMTGSSNAVNLTDGLDGLAGGTMCIVAFAIAVLALLAGWQDGQVAKYLLIPYIRNADELAIVAGAMFGASLGFLWYNCSIASIFMGDTGSLPLGGLIGYIAFVIRQELLLFVIGGIFVIEAVSVIMQVGYFKYSGGKRIFKMAPIHHHFQKSGWVEQKIVVRFWIISIVLVMVTLLTLRLR